MARIGTEFGNAMLSMNLVEKRNSPNATKSQNKAHRLLSPHVLCQNTRKEPSTRTSSPRPLFLNFKMLRPFTIAFYLLLLFAAAHTYGGLIMSHDHGSQGNSVLASMKTVHFNFNGSQCSFYGFYLGFGYMASVFLLFSAALSWHLGRVVEEEKRKGNEEVLKALRPVAWGLFLSFIPTAWLSWRFFFAGPGVFSTIIAGLLGWECFTTFWAPVGEEKRAKA